MTWGLGAVLGSLVLTGLMLQLGVVTRINSEGVAVLTVRCLGIRSGQAGRAGQVTQLWATGPNCGAVHSIYDLGPFRIDVCRSYIRFKSR
jgi:hypothetical protein